jgi:flagellar biosynthesis protein FliR
VLAEFLELNIFGFLLIFGRLGATISFMPGFSASYVSVRIRVTLALALSFAVMPAIAPNLPVLPTSVAQLGILFAGEILVGSFIGILGRVLIGALQTAGTVIALSSSMANALIQDPIAEQQSSTVSGFLLTLGIVIIFVADFHHLMIRAAMETYELFPPGAPLPVGDFAQLMARRVADSFILGIQLASPALVIGLTYYIGLGLLGRLMPQLPVFFFGLPVQVSLQLWVLTATVSGIILVFARRFQEGIGAFVP